MREAMHQQVLEMMHFDVQRSRRTHHSNGSKHPHLLIIKSICAERTHAPLNKQVQDCQRRSKRWLSKR